MTLSRASSNLTAVVEFHTNDVGASAPPTMGPAGAFSAREPMGEVFAFRADESTAGSSMLKDSQTMLLHRALLTLVESVLCDGQVG